jgi:hypothetical protein
MTNSAALYPLAGTDRESVRRALASSPELRHLVEAAGSYVAAGGGQQLSSAGVPTSLETRRQRFLKLLHRVEMAQAD